MTVPDQPFHGAQRRIWRIMLALGAAGGAVAWILGGWPWGVGFLLGAAVSMIGYAGLKRLVDGLGAQHPGRAHLAVLAGLRYFVLGAGAYAIVNYSSVNITAALAGLFVCVAAVIVEIVFELIYART